MPTVSPIFETDYGQSRTQPDVAEPDAAELENERLTYREEKKREIAEAKVKAAHIAVLRKTITNCEEAKDTAAAEHQRATEPLQEHMALVDRAQVDAILEGTKPPSNAKQRAEIFAKIEAENAKLQAGITSADSRIVDLKEEIHKISREANVTQLESELADLCSVALQVEKWVLQRDARFADLRLREARENYQQTEQLRDRSQRMGEYENARIYARRCQNWKAELERANGLLQAAIEGQETLRQRMLTGDGN